MWKTKEKNYKFERIGPVMGHTMHDRRMIIMLQPAYSSTSYKHNSVVPPNPEKYEWTFKVLIQYREIKIGFCGAEGFEVKAS